MIFQFSRKLAIINLVVSAIIITITVIMKQKVEHNVNGSFEFDFSIF